MGYPDAYCVKCGKHTDTQQKHTVLLQNNARALKGVCPSCTTDVYKILPKSKDFRDFKGSKDGEKAGSKTIYPNAYCVKCREHTPTKNPRMVMLENNTRAMQGNCAKCDSEVYRILGNQKLARGKAKTHLSLAKPTPIADKPQKTQKLANEKAKVKSARSKDSQKESQKLAHYRWIGAAIVFGAIIGAVGLSMI